MPPHTRSDSAPQHGFSVRQGIPVGLPLVVCRMAWAGQVLASLDPTGYETQVRSAEASWRTPNRATPSIVSANEHRNTRHYASSFRSEGRWHPYVGAAGAFPASCLQICESVSSQVLWQAFEERIGAKLAGEVHRRDVGILRARFGGRESRKGAGAAEDCERLAIEHVIAR